MVANVCQCEIQIEHNGQLRKEKVKTSSNTVNATTLRQQMLHFFKVGSPIDDFEVESDEDESWTLLGLNGDRGSVELDGANVINPVRSNWWLLVFPAAAMSATLLALGAGGILSWRRRRRR